MARRQRRLHVDGGIYYVFQPANPNRPIVTEESDCDILSDVVAAIHSRHLMRLHSYAFSKEGLHFALQVKNEPTSLFMDVLKTQYARRFNRVHGTSGELFGLRYRALLIEPHVYLLRLIRYIHSQPNARSSHTAYLGADHPSWLVTTVAAAMLALRKEKVLRAYQELVAQSPSPEETEFFQKDSTRHPQVLGSVTFLHRLRDVMPYRSTLTLDDVIRSVSLQRGVTVEDMLSRSRADNVVVARALVLRNATERGIATPTEVAARFGRALSTMTESLDVQRRRRPEAFSAVVYDLARSIGSCRVRQSSETDAVFEELLEATGNF